VLQKDVRCCEQLALGLQGLRQSRSPRKRRRQDSTGVTNETSSTRKCRGPGKKQRAPAPDFNKPEYRELDVKLRQEAFNPLTVEHIHEVVNLLFAFQSKVIPHVPAASQASEVRRAQLRIEFCDELEEKSQGLQLRARVQRYLELVFLADWFRKAKQAKEMGARSDNITDTFIQDLFPGSDLAEKRSTWYYYNRVGESLLCLVERFGWGALVFPGLNLTQKRFVLCAR
jgi:hypothetical protein